MAEAKTEFELIQDSYLRVWQIFITWFTWFVNINLLALGWLITSKIERPLTSFVMLMEALIVTGVGATICIFVYSVKCHRRAKEVSPQGYQLKSILPSDITLYAPIAMFIALVIVGAMWIGMLKGVDRSEPWFCL